MGHAAYFWDKIAEGYAKRPVADQGAYERKLATTQRYLRADMEVLEFGCGTGTTTRRSSSTSGRSTSPAR
jgi:cyclopropane fatty-acyl-phospholipid synthase-like methyltransferase